MAVTPIVGWGPFQLATTASVLYTAPATGKTVVTRAVFTNTDTAAHSITVYVVRSGGSVSASTTVISNYNIQPGEAYTSPELANLVLGPADSVRALASAATAITTVGSGYTI